jgi:hypothetical protein
VSEEPAGRAVAADGEPAAQRADIARGKEDGRSVAAVASASEQHQSDPHVEDSHQSESRATDAGADTEGRADPQEAKDAESELGENELRCTLCGLRACWTG